MLKLHQIYLKKFLILFMALFIIIGSVIYYWSKNFYINENKKLLLHDIKLISYNINTIKQSNLDKLVQKIKKDLNIRTTIIDQNGTVIAESHNNKSIMDNHLYRKEIINSQNNDFGVSIRHSKTINKNLLYVAKKFTDNKHNIFYIRCSKSVDEIYHNIFILGIEVFILVIIFFILIMFTIFDINKQLQNETNKIMKFLYLMTKKKKDLYINSKFSIEFQNITKYLTKIAKILNKQDKQKEKYTKRLKISNSQKDDIISAISHEFKNPITVISGYSQTLLEEQNLTNDIREKFLQKIYSNAQKLSNLIDTLRLSIKLEQNKQTIQTAKISINKIIQESIESILLSYPKRDITFKYDKEIFLKVDEVLFSIVIVNLLENALKYSQDEIIIKLNSQNISIIDNGIGISKDDIKKITDKFYRVSNNKWNNSLGLGLSIVTNILQLHGFKLEIHSIEDEGSTFKILF